MNVLRYPSRLYARRIFASHPRKGNFNVSLRRRLVSANAEQEKVTCDGIKIFTSATKPLLNNYTSVASGYDFTVFCVNHKQLMVSGVNRNSQLGLPSFHGDVIDKPTKVELPLKNSDSKILDVNCGRLHTVVLTTEGLFASGCNKLGQCGLQDKEEITSFTKIPFKHEIPVKQIACGLDHTLILTEDGTVWSCGWGADGQTGLGHTDEQRTLAPIQIPSHLKISKVSTKACGEVFSWGNAEYNQLGFSTKETLIVKPTKITALQNVVDIAIGNSVGIALSDEGDVFTWGYGFLGNIPEPCFNPTPQRLTSLDKRVVKIDCGLDYCVLLMDDKEIYIWGKLNQRFYSALPKKIELSSNAARISCAIHHLAVIVDV